MIRNVAPYLAFPVVSNDLISNFRFRLLAHHFSPVTFFFPLLPA
jgi:hypothetical protein